MMTNYVAPVDGAFADNASNPFGAGRSGGSRRHAGTDWHAPAGSPLRAIEDGVVVYSGYHQGYHAMVDILGADGNIYRYAPHESTSVKIGQKVIAGQIIGKIGGIGGGLPHLHFEIIPPGTVAFNAAKAGKFGQTSWYPGAKPQTLDPAKFFGIQPGLKVIGGQPLRGGPGILGKIGNTFTNATQSALGRSLITKNSPPGQIRSLQTALQQAGYDPGTADGKMGPLTRAAIKSFQAENGLNMDGKPGPQTLAKLADAPRIASDARREMQVANARVAGGPFPSLAEKTLAAFGTRPKQPIGTQPLSSIPSFDPLTGNSGRGLYTQMAAPYGAPAAPPASNLRGSAIPSMNPTAAAEASPSRMAALSGLLSGTGNSQRGDAYPSYPDQGFHNTTPAPYRPVAETAASMAAQTEAHLRDVESRYRDALQRQGDALALPYSAPAGTPFRGSSTPARNIPAIATGTGNSSQGMASYPDQGFHNASQGIASYPDQGLRNALPSYQLAAPGAFKTPLNVSAGLSGTARANPNPTAAVSASRPIMPVASADLYPDHGFHMGTPSAIPVAPVASHKISVNTVPIHSQQLAPAPIPGPFSSVHPVTTAVQRIPQARPNLSPDTQAVLGIQAMLNTAGFRDYEGKALKLDGVNGVRTQSAIAAFQGASSAPHANIPAAFIPAGGNVRSSQGNSGYVTPSGSGYQTYSNLGAAGIPGSNAYGAGVGSAARY